MQRDGGVRGRQDFAEGDCGVGNLRGWVEESEFHASGEEALERDVELGFGDDAFVDGVGEVEVGFAAVGVGAGADAVGGGVFGVGAGVVILGLVEVIDGAAVGGDKALEVPVLAEDVFEQEIAGAGGFAVDGVVGAHDGVGLGVDDGGAEGGEIGVPEIVRGGIDVCLVASGFGAAVDGVVLGRGDGAEVLGIVALEAA